MTFRTVQGVMVVLDVLVVDVVNVVGADAAAQRQPDDNLVSEIFRIKPKPETFCAFEWKNIEGDNK